MKKITVAVIGIQPLADGGAVVLTRPSKENPSSNGNFKLKAGAVQRIAHRTLGVTGPLAFVALKQAIAASNGQAKMTVDAILRKAGDTWKNEATGETGTYGEKNGGQDWMDYRNHEIELASSVSEKLMVAAFTAAASHVAAPVAGPRTAAPEPITEKTPGTEGEGDIEP